MAKRKQSSTTTHRTVDTPKGTTTTHEVVVRDQPAPSKPGPSIPMVDVGSDQRKIVGLMVITGTFSVAGGYTKPGFDPFKTILGVAIGSALLVGMAEFGEDAATFAQGLAVVAALTTVLVNGGPLWKALGNVFGKSQTSTTTAATTTTPDLTRSEAPNFMGPLPS